MGKFDPFDSCRSCSCHLPQFGQRRKDKQQRNVLEPRYRVAEFVLDAAFPIPTPFWSHTPKSGKVNPQGHERSL